MNKSMILSFTSLLLAGCGILPGSTQASEPPVGVAVVELFTSEGCSSCPPADKNLVDIRQAAETNHTPVYVLAWHVDYWNRLGWSDPYSTAVASQRQSDYSESFKLDEVYTPQMIVNGHVGFVGSRSDRSSQEIIKALARPQTATVSVGELKLGKPSPGGQTVSLAYATKNAPARARLLIAATESRLTSKVASGENKGRLLRHDGVVRTFVELELDHAATGQATLTLPKGVDAKQVDVIAFIEDPGNRAILGATGQALSTAASPD